MYVCKYVYVRNVLKKTRLCENSNNGNDLDIDGDESLFYNLSCRKFCFFKDISSLLSVEISAHTVVGNINIITNGGNGNKGQNGADGRKGADSMAKV